MPELRITLTADQLAAAGLVIEQHRRTPRPDQWFANGEGEYESPEAAILNGIKRITETATILEHILKEDSLAINQLILAVRHADAAAIKAGNGYMLPASLFHELRLALNDLDTLDKLRDKEAQARDDEE